ncbi:probable N-acetyltransferase HLS1-like [Carica papaya]|uniref:probable N-acetyltransferase HLS1-like n=1 Tax=Carica papaya TaxID=3649 RepID=UPI000B8C93C4|nr:probable N-acetyltransferase HLS1-like [Carica papaya]
MNISTYEVGDPLCRIRFYPLHIMLVAEQRGNGEVVGVVRGCIKHVGTKFGGMCVNLGCILGLRVSPTHRRKGIGLKLVNSIEEWMVKNGAHYTFLATEKNNMASVTLFTTKCNYVKLSSLIIFVQPASNFPVEDTTSFGSPSYKKIEKLHVDRAISFYNKKLRSKDMYPTDMDGILKENLSLGTWISYFQEEKWSSLQRKSDTKINEEEQEEEIRLGENRISPSSWVIFSIWNSCEAYRYKNIHITKSHPISTTIRSISHARDMIFTCLKMPTICSRSATTSSTSSTLSAVEKPFGFLFLYGLLGEGERLGELLKSAWSFASRLAEDVNCKVVLTELGVSDPLIPHLLPPQEAAGSAMSCIDDLWYVKKVSSTDEKDDDEVIAEIGEFGNVFIDPRDF